MRRSAGTREIYGPTFLTNFPCSGLRNLTGHSAAKMKSECRRSAESQDDGLTTEKVMPDLNKLSRQALSAAMRGGTDGWGQVGSAVDHVRYSEPLEKRRGRRRKCWCGCERPRTHRGMANGVCLTSACELGVARWVKTGSVKP